MDVSPQLLRDVEFREQWRGYSPDEVDTYLERLALVIEQLEERLRVADERAERAEREAREAVGTEHELRRTLVLAQRTADAAVAEARAEADRLVTEARAEAERLVGDAERAAAELLVDGRQRALDAEAEARRQLREEVEALHAARADLGQDVDALTAFLEEERARLTADLEAERNRLTADLDRRLEWLRAPARTVAGPPSTSATAVPPPAPVAADPGAGLPPTQPVEAVVVDEPRASEPDAATATATEPHAAAPAPGGHAASVNGTNGAHGTNGAAASASAGVVHDHEHGQDGHEDEHEPVADTAAAPPVEADAEPVGADVLPVGADAPGAGEDEDPDPAAADERRAEPGGAVTAEDTGPTTMVAADDDIPWRREAEPAPEPAERPVAGLFDDAEERGANPFAAVPPDDDFMAELRRAVSDDEPLGPRDHEPPFDQASADGDLYGADFGGRFWRRRR